MAGGSRSCMVAVVKVDVATLPVRPDIDVLG